MLSSAENKCSSGSIAALRGVEGSASRMYFSALSFFINKKFGFSGRNRRPPRDCANASLSYSYSMLYNSVDVILRNHGLWCFWQQKAAPYFQNTQWLRNAGTGIRIWVYHLRSKNFRTWKKALSIDRQNWFCKILQASRQCKDICLWWYDQWGIQQQFICCYLEHSILTILTNQKNVLKYSQKGGKNETR